MKGKGGREEGNRERTMTLEGKRMKEIEVRKERGEDTEGKQSGREGKRKRKGIVYILYADTVSLGVPGSRSRLEMGVPIFRGNLHH